MLVLQGETQAEEERGGERVERYISFYRQVRLPEDLEADRAEASYKNGALSIRFPKRAERNNVKQIPITTEQRGERPKQPKEKEKAA